MAGYLQQQVRPRARHQYGPGLFPDY